MNNDLSGVLKEADPNEVIEQLKVALKEKSAVIDDLKAERDAYRNALEEIKNIHRKYYQAGEPANGMGNHMFNIAYEASLQYPSPSKDKQNGI